MLQNTCWNLLGQMINPDFPPTPSPPTVKHSFSTKPPDIPMVDMENEWDMTWSPPSRQQVNFWACKPEAGKPSIINKWEVTMSPSKSIVLRSVARSFENKRLFLLASKLYGEVSDNLNIYLWMTDEGNSSKVDLDLQFSGGGCQTTEELWKSPPSFAEFH